MDPKPKRSLGFWAGLFRQFQLAWRLLWDPRVAGWAKLVPIMTVLYIVSPIDFIPDWFLGLGQLDDVGALLVGLRVFTQLAPDKIVFQHLQKMGVDVEQWGGAEEEPPYVNAEWEVIEEEPPYLEEKYDRQNE